MFKSKQLFFAFFITLSLPFLGAENAFAKWEGAEIPKIQAAKKQSKSDASLIVNINSADTTMLQKIKGIGKKKSEAIVEYRRVNGKFNSLEDLLKIKCRGINKKWLEKVKEQLTI